MSRRRRKVKLMSDINKLNQETLTLAAGVDHLEDMVMMLSIQVELLQDDIDKTRHLKR